MTAVDFLSRAVIENPWPVFQRLRDDDPAHWNAGLGGWCVTRYQDVTAAFKDPRYSSDRIRPFIQGQRRVATEVVKPLGDVLSLWMVFNDAPLHTRLRKLTHQAFSPKSIARLRPAIEAIVAELIDDLPRRGEVDFIDAFAYPLPSRVISFILGVPRADIPRLKRWSDDVAEFVLVSRSDASKYGRAAASLVQMCAYFSELIERRRASPEDKVIDDLISAHEDNDALSLEELVSTVVLLLFAGHETTTHFIANGWWALATHPEQYRSLAAGWRDPQALDDALDEMLRWDGPSIMQLRVAAQDIELHGRLIRQGERIFLFNAAANRDPREFSNPETFDVRRADAHRNIAFGYGGHFCLGAHLAKLEGAIAFPALLEQLGETRLLDAAPCWNDSLVIRGMQRMPVAIERRG